MRARPVLALATAALIFAAGVSDVLAQAQSAQVQQVVDTFQRARGAGDVDAALAEFADDAMVNVQSRTPSSYAGKDQVRVYLQSIGVRFHILRRSTPLVEGSAASWTERDAYGSQAVDATVTAVVRGGLITSLIYHNSAPLGTPLPTTAPSPGPSPRQLTNATWSAALGLLGFALLGVVFVWPRRRVSQSQLAGRLLLAMRGRRTLSSDFLESEPQSEPQPWPKHPRQKAA
jgi:hypothetical protein